MDEKFEVRDYRNKSMFRVDDEYLNGYSRLCGVNATMVYLCLCRHSDRYQESYPSVALMAEKTGISKRSIIRGIQTLIEWNIISKERERKENAQWLNNRYILLDKSVWKNKPSATQSLGSQVPNTTEPSAKYDKSQVPQVHTKVTHKKDTHINLAAKLPVDVIPQEIIDVLDAFKVVNPSYRKYFANKTHRASAGRLVKEHGKQKILSIISYLPKSNAEQYAPTITNAYQLEENMGKLLAWAERKKSKKKTKIAFY